MFKLKKNAVYSIHLNKNDFKCVFNENNFKCVEKNAFLSY